MSFIKYLNIKDISAIFLTGFCSPIDIKFYNKLFQ